MISSDLSDHSSSSVSSILHILLFLSYFGFPILRLLIIFSASELQKELIHSFAFVICMLFVKIRIKDQIFEKFATLAVICCLSWMERRAARTHSFFNICLVRC
ncbi:unnamed protein product [Wuchereria bancrofti]|uniref:Uncharacterized protein n=1 Tax=Wuchereria bancrofti TaxID=6293 RepID=A0A3P7E8E9_WUCBA|nr:unnamed protein product [Wuchereria bancrofti]